MKNFFANILLIAGVILFVVSSYLIFERYNPNRLSFADYIPSEGNTSVDQSTKPEFLLIPELGVKQAIVPAQKNGSKWETTTKGVSYLSTSPMPGEVGNSIFYGHNWPSILGSIVNIKPGQEIAVVFSDGSVKKFSVEYTQIVEPTQASILDQTSDKRITLYTCTGFLDTKRFVVTAFYQDPVVSYASSD